MENGEAFSTRRLLLIVLLPFYELFEALVPPCWAGHFFQSRKK
jgi:hypothetical protein